MADQILVLYNGQSKTSVREEVELLGNRVTVVEVGDGQHLRGFNPDVVLIREELPSDVMENVVYPMGAIGTKVIEEY